MNLITPLAGQKPIIQGARIYLAASSLVVFALAVALISIGVSKPWPEHIGSFLFNPFLTITAVGGVSIPLALICFAGAVTCHRLILFVYIILSLIADTLLLYAGVLCLVSNATTNTLIAQDLTRVFAGKLNLVSGGSVCIVAALVQLLSIVGAALVAGWAWTKGKLPGILNFVILILASLFEYASAYNDEETSTVNSRFAVAVSTFVVTNALLGIIAIITRWRKTLKVHTACSLGLGMMCILVATACIAAGNVRASIQTTATIYVADRMLLVGSYALIASLAIFAEAGFLIHELLYPEEAPYEAPTESIP
jgi:hypothetical protein